MFNNDAQVDMKIKKFDMFRRFMSKKNTITLLSVYQKYLPLNRNDM